MTFHNTMVEFAGRQIAVKKNHEYLPGFSHSYHSLITFLGIAFRILLQLSFHFWKKKITKEKFFLLLPISHCKLLSFLGLHENIDCWFHLVPFVILLTCLLAPKLAAQKFQMLSSTAMLMNLEEAVLRGVSWMQGEDHHVISLRWHVDKKSRCGGIVFIRDCGCWGWGWGQHMLISQVWSSNIIDIIHIILSVNWVKLRLIKRVHKVKEKKNLFNNILSQVFAWKWAA